MTALTRLLDAARAATPGPWKIEADEPTIIREPKGFFVAYALKGLANPEQTNANARFIAAASPEIVETLCEVIAKYRQAANAYAGENYAAGDRNSRDAERLLETLNEPASDTSDKRIPKC